MDSPFSPTAGSPYNLQLWWEDGERVFWRGWRDSAGGAPTPVVVILPAAEHPPAFILDRLAHEYNLKGELDAAWAAVPLDLVHTRDRTILVLEDDGGEPLSRLAGRPMEVGEFLRLAVGIALAIGGVHDRGLIHKDIKPANILVEPTTGVVRLTGFGVASRRPRERQAPKAPEVIAGTLPYMAPEQSGRMNRSVDSRSDLYAFGVTLYEILTGSLPFSATEPMEWVHCHIARQATPPAERSTRIPAPLSDLVMKLLAKTAEERYQTAAGVAADLRHCQAEWDLHGRIAPFPLGMRDASEQLKIPEALYGREGKIDTLLSSFDRVVASGAPGFVLVSGYSGIGKSAVVNELHRALVPSRGLFASGKFDQYKRDIPYITLAQAFRSLVRPLLSRSEAELHRWREVLREALGQNGHLVVHLVPELELVIGKQPPVPDLPPQEAKSRFQMVFRGFLGVFARSEHPLALFLDDLQWLDAATLELIEHLATHPDVRHLLLIGAYRDNEVTAQHPLLRTLDTVRKSGTSVEEIRLAPLGGDDLGRLLADTLGCSTNQVHPLTRLVHEKTGGNPFFAIQFISALAEDGLLNFDREVSRWRWDLGRVHAKGYTDNVIDLMVGKLVQLPAATQAALQKLACFGNIADAAMLSIILGKSDENVGADLWDAIRLELIEHQEGSYKFIHDRVQEAAYSLIPEASRAEAHLRIGRLLAANTPAEKRAETIFELVNQLNRGCGLITARDERESLAELNLLAGQRAKTTSAYDSALTYLVAGVALLPEDAWDRRHALVFALEWQRAECEFLAGDLTAASERLAMLSSHAADTVERARVACLHIDLFTALNQPERAVAIGLAYLRGIDINWSPQPTDREARREYDRIWSQIGDRAIEVLIDLPLMSDPASHATMDVLTAMVTPALWTDPNLLSLIVCGAVNLSLQSGNSDGSCFTFVWLGVLAGWHFDDYQAGYRFGRLGCELAEKRGLKRYQARAYLIFGNLVLPWTRHIRAGRDFLRNAFEAASEAGDLTFAAYSCDQLNTNFLASGDALEEVQFEVEKGLAFARKANFVMIADIISSQFGLIKTLRGLTADFGSFDDETFDEARYERRFVLELQACRYWIGKLQAQFFAEDYISALDASAKAAPLLWTSVSTFEVAEHHFFSALTHAALCAPTPDAQRQRHIEALKAHHEQLERWAVNCPANFGPRAALVGAEVAKIEGREMDAMHLYEQAIGSARDSGFVQNEALANEITSRFYAARGFEKIAQMYMRDARRCYATWGAAGKVRQLEQAHPYLTEVAVTSSPASVIETPIQQLDLATVIKVSQAASGEIVLEKLLETMMRAALEHAGAERGVLALVRNADLRIAAEASTGVEKIVVDLQDRPLSAEVVPEAILRYTARTKETLVLDDAAAQSEFADDPYIARRRARSILCLPLLKQSKLIGVLYLENGLSPRVFSLARIATLELLASQAAISLENTYLYHDLAERESRIRRLVDANIVGIMIWDREGRITEANETILRIIGYGREDLLSGAVTLENLTPPEWLPGRDQAWIPAPGKSGSLQPFERELIRKDGSRVPVMFGAADFGDSSDSGVSFVLDLTEQQRAAVALRDMQLQLEHATRIATIGQLTSSIAHEVNQPISGALTNAYTALRILNRSEPDLEKARRSIERIVRDSTRAGAVVNRLRDLIKKAPPQLDSLDINTIVGEVVDFTRSEAVKNAVSVETMLDANLPRIGGDRVGLQQVMINLIINAIQAMNESRDRHQLRIISGRTEGDHVFVSVCDSGPGLAPAVLEHLFQPFQTTKPNGLGLGLSICRSIIEAHGGRLSASPNVPSGAVFRLELPAHGSGNTFLPE